MKSLQRYSCGTYALIPLLFFVTLLPLIGLAGISGSSEAREVHIATEVAAGNWILPTRNGIVPSKPPLFHWFCALIGVSGLGVSEFSCRAISLLAGTLLLFITGIAAGRFFKEVQTEPARSYATFSQAILALTYGYTTMANEAMVDMTYALFAVTALLVYLHGLFDRQGQAIVERRYRLTHTHYFLFSICAGLAVLGKGPIGVLLPGALSLIAFSFVLGWRAAARALLIPHVSWILFFVIAVTWYLLAARSGGDAFVERQLIFENLKRVIGGESINREAFWFYIPSVLRTAAPWSWVFFAAVLSIFFRPGWMRRPYVTDIVARLQFVPMVVVVSGIFLFSLASGKRHSYLLPLFPALSIAVMHIFVVISAQQPSWANMALRLKAGAERSAIYFLLVVLLGLELCALPWSSGRVVGDLAKNILAEHRLPFQAVAVIALLLKAVVSRWRFQELPLVRFVFSVAPVIVGFLLTISMGAVIKEEFKDFHGIARQVTTLVAPGEPLWILRTKREEYFDPLMLHLGRPVQVADGDFQQNLSGVWVLARPKIIATLSPHSVGCSSAWEETKILMPRIDSLVGRTSRAIWLGRCW